MVPTDLVVSMVPTVIVVFRFLQIYIFPGSRSKIIQRFSPLFFSMQEFYIIFQLQNLWTHFILPFLSNIQSIHIFFTRQYNEYIEDNLERFRVINQNTGIHRLKIKQFFIFCFKISSFALGLPPPFERNIAFKCHFQELFFYIMKLTIQDFADFCYFHLNGNERGIWTGMGGGFGVIKKH